ncbi:hypothetical protein ACIHCQ_08415 [Streptomyces sp. NPDC052236]|uniref:hypothetical protein n=1 Tax=Streptomyces sp. NPDC052236 TaxID=3365686 RepID=UPI0037CED88B
MTVITRQMNLFCLGHIHRRALPEDELDRPASAASPGRRRWVTSILDVGGGSGIHSASWLERNPAARPSR